MDRAAVDGIGFWLGSAGDAIQQIGLPLSLSCFSRDGVAFATTTTNLNKDLQGDKECYATGVVGKRDSYVA